NLGDGARATQARLRSPAGLATDGNGVVWISDTGNNRVRKVLPDGTMSMVHDGGVTQPLGLAVDGAGTLYIGDSGNNRIRAVRADGGVSTVAGTGAPGYSGDGGLAIQAQLNGPASLVVMSAPSEAASVIWFADANNQRIRMLYRGGDIGESQIQPGKLVHAATNQEGAVAPGEIVTLYGSGLGPVTGRAGALSQGSMPLALEGVELRFDGLAAPLFYVSETQINAQVPYRVAGRARVQVEAKYQGFTRFRGAVDLVDAAPGLFLVGGASTQCAALNQDGSLNGAGNPAAVGSIVVLYATGEGLTDPMATEGRPAAPPLAKPTLPVRVELNGIATQILYAGAAPGFAGLMQINIRVPATGVRTGNVPVTLKVGSYSSPAGATIAVR
ncbi:MAG: hypothetical protein MUC42_08445, partial [Bryobacter sp.]|nr:hypothetical protein [Bryobacter sp.]